MLEYLQILSSSKDNSLKMLRALLLLCCIAFFNLAFAQEKSKEALLRKSKNQKTVAWILLGTGTAAMVSGIIIDNSHEAEDQSYTGGYFEVAGLVCTLTSIPFFIRASKNKRWANAITLNHQRIMIPSNGRFNLDIQPSLCLHIPLR